MDALTVFQRYISSIVALYLLVAIGFRSRTITRQGVETMQETISQAQAMANRFESAGVDPQSTYIGAPPAPSTVSHEDYSVSYYADDSILICAKGETPLVLDDDRTYYRDTVEHLARCLGMFTQEQRAEMIKKACQFGDANGRGPVWIDGIAWNRDGSFADM